MSEPISPEMVEQIARLAIAEYKKADERRKAERHDRNLRNTKKLMRIMPTLREHSNASISELSDVCDDDGLDVLIQLMKDGCGDLHIESIRRSVAKTRLMLDHINAMIDVYRTDALKSSREEVRRRYRVLEMMYLADNRLEPEEIAKIENIDKRTVYKDVDAACERLSYYIFGIDAF